MNTKKVLSVLGLSGLAALLAVVSMTSVSVIQGQGTDVQLPPEEQAPGLPPATFGTPSFAVRTLLTGANEPGSRVLEVESGDGFAVGDFVRINPGGANEEDNQIDGFGSIVLVEPLKYAHDAGEPIVKISAEEMAGPEAAELPATGSGGPRDGAAAAMAWAVLMAVGATMVFVGGAAWLRRSAGN